MLAEVSTPPPHPTPPPYGAPQIDPMQYPAGPQPPAQKSKTSCGVMLLVALGVSVPLLGVLAALAIYGVRRYIGASKTSEAKNTVGAICRGAAAAYEREQPGDSGVAHHELCASATPVPISVPAGKKYLPDHTAGQDYESGDDTSGWRCLHFGLNMPQYYQYHYYRDTMSVAPANPDACRSNCFEAGAMGDLDADGIYSRFSRTGQINSATGQLQVDQRIYIEAEFE